MNPPPAVRPATNTTPPHPEIARAVFHDTLLRTYGHFDTQASTGQNVPPTLPGTEPDLLQAFPSFIYNIALLFVSVIHQCLPAWYTRLTPMECAPFRFCLYPISTDISGGSGKSKRILSRTSLAERLAPLRCLGHLRDPRKRGTTATGAS
jgi:hypothetical protein